VRGVAGVLDISVAIVDRLPPGHGKAGPFVEQKLELPLMRLLWRAGGASRLRPTRA